MYYKVRQSPFLIYYLIGTILIFQIFFYSFYHRQIGEISNSNQSSQKYDEKMGELLTEVDTLRSSLDSEREKIRELQSYQALNGIYNPVQNQNNNNNQDINNQNQNNQQQQQQQQHQQLSRIQQLQELQQVEILHVTGADENKPLHLFVSSNNFFKQPGAVMQQYQQQFEQIQLQQQLQQQQQQSNVQQSSSKKPNIPKTWPIRDPPNSLQPSIGKWSPEIFKFPAGNEEKGCVAVDADSEQVLAAVVIVAFNRPQYLTQMLDYLFEAYDRNSKNEVRFPLYVSQDGTNAEVENVIKTYFKKGVRHMQHVEIQNVTTEGQKENAAYYRIANHYKYIMQQFFQCFKYPKLLILEDDMQLSVDFFEYFAATSQLLDSDPSIYCVSSWNDHGQEKFVSDPEALYRSDFFPGLGWMLTQQLGLELLQDWPKSYWDDWMRLSNVRKGRQCVRPEICRNYNFGEKGTSKGFYYRKFIKPIKLNAEDVDWSSKDLSYLHQDQYENYFMDMVNKAKSTSIVDVAKTTSGDVRLEYNSQEQYEAHTLALGMLREWKDGVPRGAYNRIVTIKYDKARIFLVPGPDFKEDASVAVGQRVVVDSTGAVVRKKKPQSSI